MGFAAGGWLAIATLFASAQSVERRHDVTALVAPRGEEAIGVDLWPQPLPRAENAAPPEENVASVALSDEGTLAELVEALWGDAVDVTAEAGALRIAATADVHDDVAELLAALSAAMVGDAQLDVRVLAGVADAGGATFRPLAESERLERELVASGRAKLERAGTAPLADGLGTRLLQRSTSTIVAGFSLEVSSGAAVHAPLVEARHAGLRVAARPARTAGATLLDVAIVAVAPAAETRRRKLAPKVWCASPLPAELADLVDEARTAAIAKLGKTLPFVLHEPVALELDAPLDCVGSVATTLLLPDGYAAWIPTRLDSVAGPVAATVVVRVTGTPRSPVVALPGAHGGRERLLLHRGAAESAGFERDERDGESLAFVDDPVAPCRRDRFLQWPRDRLEPRLRAELEEQPHAAAPLLIELSNEALFVEADAVADESRGSLATLAQRHVEQERSVELRGRLRAGDAVVGEFRVPATAGRRATLWSGIAGSRVADWEVAVADFAAAAAPRMEPWLDGVLLDFVVVPLAPDRCELAIDGVLQRLDHPPAVVATGSPYAPEIDSLDARRVALHERAVVALERGRGVVRFGDGALSLEVEVTLAPEPAAARAFAVDGVSTLHYALPLVAGSRSPAVAPLDLAPVRWRMDGDDAPAGESTGLAPEEIVTQFSEELAEELPDESVELELQEDGELLSVTGRTAIHAWVEERLRTLVEEAFRGARLEVRAFAGAPPIAAAEFVAIAEADRRIAAAVAAGVAPPRIATAALEERRPVACAVESLRDVVADFDCAYARGASIYEPIVATVRSGLEARCVAEPTARGHRLDFALRQLEESARREIVAKPKLLLASPFPGGAYVSNEEQPLRIAEPTSALWSGAGSVELPAGHALWLPCRAKTAFGEQSLLLDVRVVGGDPIATPRHGLRRLQWNALSGFQLPEFPEEALQSVAGRGGSDESCFPSLPFAEEPDDEAGGEGGDATRAAYSVVVRARRGLDLVAECSTITAPDRAALLWAGALSNGLRTWEAETASESKIAEPEMVSFLDGLTVALAIGDHGGARDGVLTVTLRAALNLLSRPPTRVELANPDSPLIERLDADRLIVDRVVDVRLVGGVATIAIPGAPLSLEVEVRKLEGR